MTLMTNPREFVQTGCTNIRTEGILLLLQLPTRTPFQAFSKEAACQTLKKKKNSMKQ